MQVTISLKLCIRLAALIVAAVLVVAVYQAWRGSRRDRAELAAELAATKQTLAASDARQQDRDSQLKEKLGALAAEKRTVRSPSQIIKELPNLIPLPTPLVAAGGPPAGGSEGVTQGLASGNPAKGPSDAGGGPTSQVQIPVEDLKPLYDFALDCKVCQAKLATAQGDLADERIKTVTLTQERDAALKIARGGSIWRRVGRAAKWFAIGAAAGAVAARAAH
jgi:type II secretory pathway pseudopilin PulG